MSPSPPDTTMFLGLQLQPSAGARAFAVGRPQGVLRVFGSWTRHIGHLIPCEPFEMSRAWRVRSKCLAYRLLRLHCGNIPTASVFVHAS